MRRRPEARQRCPARYHDRPNDYTRHGCRCPETAFAYSQLREARATGRAPAGRVPSAATTRRIRGLYAAGHDASTVAAAANITAVTVRVLLGSDGSLRPERAGRPIPPIVLATTADAITAAAARLARLPGRSVAARARAARAGWAPLHAWDGDVFSIDDPDADDALAASTVGMATSLRRAVLEEAIAERAAQEERAETRRRLLDVARLNRHTTDRIAS
jgi:hypothetical protein